MQAQLDRLAALAGHSKVTIQVIPGSIGHAGLLGGFVLAELAGKPPMVYLETAAEGQVTDSPSVAANVAPRFEKIRSEDFGAEYRGAVAVLEGEADTEVALDGRAHGVPGHHPQQLPAGCLVGRRLLVVGKVGAGGVQLLGQVGDELPGVGQGGLDAGSERRVVYLAVAGLVEQVGRDGQ
jgi:Domain of unknown function (DUF5753)